MAEPTLDDLLETLPPDYLVELQRSMDKWFVILDTSVEHGGEVYSGEGSTPANAFSAAMEKAKNRGPSLRDEPPPFDPE